MTEQAAFRQILAETMEQARAAERAATQDRPQYTASAGTVTSVAMTVPSILSVSGSPVTTAGTLAVTLANQSANQVLAGPTGGGAAAPTFRSLVAADIPALSYGTVTSVALSLPAIFSVSGSPVTTTGTLTGTLATQTANYIWAGPTTGAAAAPTFRAMVSDDIPSAIVTYAKIQNMTTARLLGRTTAGSGVVEEISVGSGLTLTGGVLDTTGGAAVTGTGTDTYLTRWTGASSIGDSNLYLASGRLTSATSSGLKVVPAAANASNVISADAALGYSASLELSAVDRDGGGAISRRAVLTLDSAAGTIDVYGNLVFDTDATYDIGASGANRARDAYLSRSLYAANIKLLGSGSGTATITPPAAAGTPTLTLPTSTGTLALTSDITTAVSGTSGKLAKFTGTNTVGNSIITESGATLSAAGTFTIVGQSDTNQLVVRGHATQTSGQIVIQTSAAAELARFYVLANYSMGIGYLAGQNVTGANNIAIGPNALKTQTSGTSNIAIGSTALRDLNSGGQENTAIGARCLESLTNGDYNMAIGSTCLYLATTAINNMAMGTNSCLNVTGSGNVGVGVNTFYYSGAVSDNVGIGWAAGLTCGGDRNTLIGTWAGYSGGGSAVAFSDSVYIGNKSGYGSNVGNKNTAVGSESLQKVIAGATAMGYRAGYVATGAGQVLIGYEAGAAVTTGTNNTIVGYQAGASLSTNGGSVMIGYQAGYSETAANKLYIANSSTTTPLIYGDFSTPSLTFNGTVTHADGYNIVLGTTTGSKLGTATSQKLGVWNTTPIVQPTTAVAAATFTANAGTAVNDASTFDGYTIGQVVKALRNIGWLA